MRDPHIDGKVSKGRYTEETEKKRMVRKAEGKPEGARPWKAKTSKREGGEEAGSIWQH